MANSGFTPRRYWGPGNTGDGGSPLGTPNQASVILARINARARARKASTLPLVNGPSGAAGKEGISSNEVSEDSRKLAHEVISSKEQLTIEGREKKEGYEKLSGEPNVISKDGVVTAMNEDLSDGCRKKKRSKTLKAIALDEQVSIEEREKKEGYEKYSSEPDITSKDEMVPSVNEEPSDGCRKKKRDKTLKVVAFDEQVSSEQSKRKGHEKYHSEPDIEKDEIVTVVNEVLSDECRKKKRSKTHEVIALDNQFSTEGRKNKEEHEKYSNEPNSTGKDELITTVNEALSDGSRKKKKVKQKGLGDESEQTAENRVNELVNDEHIPNDLEAESPKRKKRKESASREVLLNGIDSFSCSEGMAHEVLHKKKKKKKKESEDHEDRKSSLEEMNCVSDAFADDSFMNPSKKRKKKDKICQVEESNIILHESKNEPEDAVVEELSKKKKKKRKREKCEREEKLIAHEEDIKSFDDVFTRETKKKKKKKSKEELPDEENNIQNNEINECDSNIVKNEKVLCLKEHQKINSENFHKVLNTKETIESEAIEDKSELDAASVDKKVAARNKRRKKKEKKKRAKEQGEIGGFTLMKEVKSARKEKVQRTLPYWLANPTVIGRDLHSDGASIESIQGMDASLQKILKEQNIQKLFPVQKAVIPEILSSSSSLSTRYRPQDICVSAPTGSGKTLAYVLPIIQALKGRTVPRIRALVLLPVQELALQVYKVFQTYKKGSKLKVGIAVGQSTFQKEQSSLVAHDYGGYRSLIDILVATPGRLDDHLKITKGIDLSSLRYLVLDEADRMLTAEGGEWVNCIEKAIKPYEAASENVLIGGFQGSGITKFPQVPIHRLLFSATLSHDPEQLQHMALYRPKLFTVSDSSNANIGVKKKELPVGTVVGQYTRPAELKEEYIIVDESVKPLVLHHLITTKCWRRVLVFTNSVTATHKLAVLMGAMSEGLTFAEFSSSQKSKRHQIVSQFASGKIDILISSDAMARGIDIPDIEHVVSYDVTSVNTYVHRIGRTARAGKSGTALSLITKDVMSDFRAMLSSSEEKATELTVSTEELEPYESLYINALAKMKEIILQEQQKKIEEMDTRISRNNQHERRRHLNHKRVRLTGTGVQKFVKRMQYSRGPHNINR